MRETRLLAKSVRDLSPLTRVGSAARYEDVFAPAIRDAGLEPLPSGPGPGVTIPIEDIQAGIESVKKVVPCRDLDGQSERLVQTRLRDRESTRGCSCLLGGAHRQISFRCPAPFSNTVLNGVSP